MGRVPIYAVTYVTFVFVSRLLTPMLPSKYYTHIHIAHLPTTTSSVTTMNISYSVFCGLIPCFFSPFLSLSSIFR